MISGMPQKQEVDRVAHTDTDTQAHTELCCATYRGVIAARLWLAGHEVAAPNTRRRARRLLVERSAAGSLCKSQREQKGEQREGGGEGRNRGVALQKKKPPWQAPHLAQHVASQKRARQLSPGSMHASAEKRQSSRASHVRFVSISVHSGGEQTSPLNTHGALQPVPRQTEKQRGSEFELGGGGEGVQSFMF